MTAAAVVLVVPVRPVTPRRRRRAGSLVLDWIHLVSGSIWLGGLVGLLVLWSSLPAAPGSRVWRRRATVLECRASPRCSCCSGRAPGRRSITCRSLAALWQTNYGQAVILVKTDCWHVGERLAAVNLARTKPRLVAARRQRRAGGARGAPAAAHRQW